MAGIVRVVILSGTVRLGSALSRLTRGGWIVLFLLVGQVSLVGSLMIGRDTLYLRDVLRTHGAFDASRVREWDAGRPAPVDPYRAGGQPGWGNPNTRPFYPTAILYGMAPRLWSLNAHFWIHLLVAPWSLFWMGRRLGLGPGPAMAGGAFYGLSGFVLSHLSFANLVVGAALAPALAAAWSGVLRSPRPRGVIALGGLWALLLLAGDPLYAGFALALAVVVGLAGDRVEDRAERVGAGSNLRTGFFSGVGALLAGTLLVAPQLGETFRVFSSSLRGIRGFDLEHRTLASWDPHQLVEWFLPLFFGRVDRLGEQAFWGQPFHPGGLPLFLSLAPGLVVLLLALVAGVGGRIARLGWVLVGIGIFVALGRFNPILRPVFELPVSAGFRFPIKAWLWVAPGLALLAARGLERLSTGDPEARSRAGVTWALLSVLLGGLLVWVGGGLGSPGLEGWIPEALGDGVRSVQRGRWLAVGGVSLTVLAVTGAALRGVRPQAWLGTVLVALHVGSQVLLLAPLAARERVDEITGSPRLADAISGSRWVHSRAGGSFGPPTVPAGPSGDARLLVRQGAFSELPFVGIPRGRRYELNPSPEGLDAFVTHLARDAVRSLPDRERLRLLRLWGVETVVLDRPLEEPRGATLRVEGRAYGARFFVYSLEDPVAPVRRVSGVRSVREPRRALIALLDPELDPRREVVLAGTVETARPGPGRVRIRRETPLELRLTTEGERPGFVVVERTLLPLYRAMVDTREVELRLANLHRIAIPVPAGASEVRLWIDRSPLRGELGASLAGVLLLGLVALRARSRC